MTSVCRAAFGWPSDDRGVRPVLFREGEGSDGQYDRPFQRETAPPPFFLSPAPKHEACLVSHYLDALEVLGKQIADRHLLQRVFVADGHALSLPTPWRERGYVGLG